MIKLGLVGENINHSLSRKIHEFSLHSLGVKGLYSLYDLPATALPIFLYQAWESGLHGLNVTTPYKKTIAGLTYNQQLSSVNTLFREEGKDFWSSCSTDSVGFVRGLEKIGVSTASIRRLVILGAGGVLPAILNCFQSSKPEIFILRRNPLGDEDLKKAYCGIEFRSWLCSELEGLLEGAGEETLLVQASSAPLRGDSLQGFAKALNRFEGVMVDLVYGSPSFLFQCAREKKLRCQDGLAMLIEQARASQELWLGTSADYKSIDFELTGADGRN